MCLGFLVVCDVGGESAVFESDNGFSREGARQLSFILYTPATVKKSSGLPPSHPLFMQVSTVSAQQRPRRISTWSLGNSFPSPPRAWIVELRCDQTCTPCHQPVRERTHRFCGGRLILSNARQQKLAERVQAGKNVSTGPSNEQAAAMTERGIALGRSLLNARQSEIRAPDLAAQSQGPGPGGVGRAPWPETSFGNA